MTSEAPAQHLRTRIRAALLELWTGLPTLDENVYASRVRPLRPEECPGVNIRSGPEPEIDRATAGFPSRLTRGYDVVTEIFVRANDGYEDAFDAILAEMEAELAASLEDCTLGGLARGGVALAAIAEPEIDGEGDKTVLRCDVTWRASYFADQDDPTTPR